MANPTTTYKGPDGRVWIDVDFGDKTLVAADSGIVQNVVKDGVTVTLPATVVGHYYIIRNGGAEANATPRSGSNGTVLVNTLPTGTDGFTGAGITAAASKGVNNTKATSIVGDEVQLLGTGVNSAVGWVITFMSGTWVRTT